MWFAADRNFAVQSLALNISSRYLIEGSKQSSTIVNDAKSFYLNSF